MQSTIAPRWTRLVAALLAAVTWPASHAAEPVTANTVTLSPGEASPPASLAVMAWLPGQWTGEGLGGFSEETWSPARDGVMLGMYRLIREGKPAFYELMTMVEERGSLVLRLKHFNPDLSGWEERDESVDFPLVAVGDGRIQFDGLTFEPRGSDTVTIYLAVREKGSRTAREEIFRYRRTAQATP